ncbi:MucR family transcriptional regulator [Hyphomonas sp.]|uniref:MucR family transcriptional regulator n=1 Tax=Hyphomonas sp. TaxID=87 RepID=UPI0039188DA4
MQDRSAAGPQSDICVEHAAEIVAAYVSRNQVGADALPALIRQVHASLTGLSAEAPEPPAPPQKPAVPVRKSVQTDYLICLEDGMKFKSLKRHLRSKYDMTPEQYREKWGLPADYPMVAPGYSEKRSKLAKKMRLGKARSQA